MSKEYIESINRKGKKLIIFLDDHIKENDFYIEMDLENILIEEMHNNCHSQYDVAYVICVRSTLYPGIHEDEAYKLNHNSNCPFKVQFMDMEKALIQYQLHDIWKLKTPSEIEEYKRYKEEMAMKNK